MRRVLLLTFGFLLVLAATAVSFKLLSSRWPEPRVQYSNGALPEPFRTAFKEAAQEWTSQTGFVFEISGNNPACDLAGTLLNGADFFPTDCDGALLGPDTLAVTEIVSIGGETIATGITFNSEFVWAVYNTPLRPNEPDFRRVALHELGHVGSLGHEDLFPAIMNSRIDDTISLQPDDLDGIKAAYPVLEDFEPETPAGCSGNLKAAGSFCNAVFTCLSANAKNPALGTRVGCTAGAEAAFVAANGCAAAANSLTNGVFAIDEAIAAGVESSDRNHRKLQSKVLKQGGKDCSKALVAEGKNARKPNASKLNKKRSKARAAFIRKAGKAVMKGERKGNPYTGPSPTELADQIDLLVDDTTASMTAAP